MPKFLRKLEFEKVIKALWNTSKSRFIEEVSFDDATQILSQTKDGQTEEVADLTIYAKKDEENHFTENNLFKDVFLETLEPYIDNLGSYTNFAGGIKKTGRRDFTSHSNGNDGYVKSLLIRLSNGMGTGSKTNVSVWEVEKGSTALDDVANKIVDNVQETVLEYGGIKYIEVPIYKKYENPTYFIFQISPSADMAYYQSPTNMEDYIYIDGDVAVDGTSINANKNKQHIGVYGIIGNHIRVRDFLKDYVDEWTDLHHVYDINSTNIFDVKNLKYGKYFNNFAPGLVNSDDYAYYTFDCNPGDTFTVIKKQHDSQTFGFLDTNGNVIENGRVGQRVVNGRTYYHLTVPQTPTIVKAGFNVHLPSNKVSEVELHTGHIQPTANFMPNTNGAEIIVDGTQISIGFDPMDSGLSSTTVESAIRESVLLSKTSLNNKVDRSEVGTGANQIPQLDQNGKLPSTIIPNIAITKIVDVADEVEALELSRNNEIQTGDFVRVASRQNKIYIHKEASVGDFDTRFIEITSGNAGNNVSSVNGQTPVQGNVTVDATHIKLDGQNSQTVKQEFDTLNGRVDNCVIRVNGENPINGEVTVNAGQIRAAVGGVVNNVQHYLNVISDGLKTVNTMAVSNRNKITMLETKKPPVQAGDIITTFKNNGEVYTVGGVTYLYCGVRKVVTRNNYPQLADALGLASSVNNFEYPYFADTKHTYDNGQRTATKRTYICAKVV